MGIFRIEATEPNTEGVVSVKVSYTNELKGTIRLLLLAADIESELNNSETGIEDRVHFVKFKCQKEKLESLTTLSKDVLARMQTIQRNNPNDPLLN